MNALSMPPSVPLSPVSDVDLWRASRAGDRDAFGRIVERYQSLVAAIAYSRTGDLSAASDFAQETFVAAWRQQNDLREPALLKSWLAVPLHVDLLIGGSQKIQAAGDFNLNDLSAPIINLTGLGLRLSGQIVELGGGSLAVTILLAAFAMWILGTAIPVTASYIIAAVILVPALVSLDVPAPAAHMFMFYYAVLADVSPPTALAPFAASAICDIGPEDSMDRITRAFELHDKVGVKKDIERLDTLIKNSTVAVDAEKTAKTDNA